MKAHDTAELFFEDVRLPKTALLGGLNKGFYHLMTELPQERLQIGSNYFLYERNLVFQNYLHFFQANEVGINQYNLFLVFSGFHQQHQIKIFH